MQKKWVQSVIWEDPTCHRATKPVCHNYWACALEPGTHNYWALAPQILKPVYPRDHALQQEKSLQLEASAPLESSLCLPQLEKSPCSNEDPTQWYINKYIYTHIYI